MLYVPSESICCQKAEGDALTDIYIPMWHEACSRLAAWPLDNQNETCDHP